MLCASFFAGRVAQDRRANMQWHTQDQEKQGSTGAQIVEEQLSKAYALFLSIERMDNVALLKRVPRRTSKHIIVIRRDGFNTCALLLFPIAVLLKCGTHRCRQ